MVVATREEATVWRRLQLSVAGGIAIANLAVHVGEASFATGGDWRAGGMLCRQSSGTRPDKNFAGRCVLLLGVMIDWGPAVAGVGCQWLQSVAGRRR